jgi:hypothetical protein
MGGSEPHASYFYIEVDPGPHYFCLKAGACPGTIGLLSLMIEKGKTYYRDRFGNLVKPREWFLVPLFVVNELVERIRDGSITGYVYDPKAARLVKAAS